jgi:hypothetical protein
VAFGEPVDEECPSAAPEKNYGPVALRSSLAWPGNPLFDDPTTKIGVDPAIFGPSNSLEQDRIRNPLLPGKALKPPGLEDSQSEPYSIL